MWVFYMYNLNISNFVGCKEHGQIFRKMSEDLQLNKLHWDIYLAPGHFNCWVLVSLTRDEKGSTNLLFVLFLWSDAE